jgi:RAB protein geranylgeranyltransferase component A
MDRNDYYGGESTSLNLIQVKKTFSDFFILFLLFLKSETNE